MRATEFEFRHRFFFIGGLFTLAFSCNVLDPRSVAVWLTGALGRPDPAALRIVFAFAALLAAAAAALRTWAAAYLHSGVVHDLRLHSDRLVADGPYRHLRNPLYVGTWLLTLGIGFMASRLGWLILIPGIALFTFRLIRREEAMLEASQGPAFVEFRNAVPLAVPSLRPRIPASGRAPQWGQAFRGELFMWVFALAMFTYAATLRPRVTYLLFMAAVGGYAILNLIARKRESPDA